MEEHFQFGRYELVERLAVGGMAVLYRAILTGPSGFRKTVAIKVIKPHLIHQEHFREMFLHEGRIMAAMSHRNLVQVFDLGEIDNELFMCLEYIPGCNLSQVLTHLRERGRPMDPFLAAWLAREICQGLEYVHGMTNEHGVPLNIVHRDVNPPNVLLSQHGDIKLSDFGIAISLAKDEQTLHGEVKGKMNYLSPEQATGESVSPASDLYGVGLMLYELLTLQRYILGIDRAELLRAAASPSWRPIAPTNPDVPEKLEKIVERALRVKAEDRFATARTFAKALAVVIETAPRAPGSNDLVRLITEICGAPSSDPDQTAFVGKTDEPGTSPKVKPSDPQAKPSATPRVSNTVSLAVDRKELIPSRRNLLFWALGLGAGLLVVAILWLSPSPTNRSIPIGEPSNSNPLASINRPPEPNPVEPTKITEETDLGQGSSKGNKKGIKHPPKKKNHKTTNQTKIVFQQTPPKPEANFVELKKRLDSFRKELRLKGVRPRDLPELDRTLSAASRQLSRHDPEAEKTISILDKAVQNLVIDHQFIERKIIRFQETLAKSNQQEKFSGDLRTILNYAINNQFARANSEINRVLDQIERTK